MHAPAKFQASGDAARELISQRPLATLMVNGAEGPVIGLAPMIWSADSNILIGHLAKANALHAFKDETDLAAVALFRGPDAYITPSAYPSKAEHGRAVPTWNYMAVEARGTLRFETAPTEMHRFIEPLTKLMEQDRPNQWAISDAPKPYTDRLSSAIFGVELTVTKLSCVHKLSQNKSEADRLGVIAELNKESDYRANEIAARMKAELHS